MAEVAVVISVEAGVILAAASGVAVSGIMAIGHDTMLRGTITHRVAAGSF